MHVLHLSATGAIGGAERSLLDILASVQQTTPDWRLSVVTGADGNLVAEARALGAGVTVIPYGAALARLGESGGSGARLGAAALAGGLARSARPAVQYIVELRRVIEELGPDVIHTHGLKMHILAAGASRSSTRLRPRVVWHVHDYVGTRRATARFLRWSLRRCDAIVTNSSSVAADVHETLHPSVPVVVVHNAVDLRRFSPSGPRLDLDRLAGLPAAPRSVVRVGLIGTFARWKGHTTFFDAIARLGESVPIRAYVIGDALYHTAGSQYSMEELRASQVVTQQEYETAQLNFASASSAQAQWSDGFDRADGGVGGTWTAVSGTITGATRGPSGPMNETYTRSLSRFVA
jgi:glycosyltransferase involved in cell wall biosynthesis